VALHLGTAPSSNFAFVGKLTFVLKALGCCLSLWLPFRSEWEWNAAYSQISRLGQEIGSQGLWKADSCGLSPDDGGRWTLLCDPHSTLLQCDTRDLARSHMSAPEGWCCVCSGEETIEDLGGEE